MGEGALEAALVEGDEDLDVVGESHRQEELWRVLGGRHRPEIRVRMDVYALLLAEDGNPYDANAVSVWIDGMMVGYLPRDEARRLRPGLLALQERKGKPITGHTDFVWGVAFSPDGTVVATTSHDRTARLWNVATGQTVRTLIGQFCGVEFSPRWLPARHHR